MPETSSVEVQGGDGRPLKEVTFATTPIMSTYLLAYIVGEFESIEDKTAEGIAVRVFTVPGLVEEVRRRPVLTRGGGF